MASQEAVSGSTGVGHLPTALTGDESTALPDALASEEARRLLCSKSWNATEFGNDNLSPFQQKVQKVGERRRHLRSRIHLKRSQSSSSQGRRPEERGKGSTVHRGASSLGASGRSLPGFFSSSRGPVSAEPRLKSRLRFAFGQAHRRRKPGAGEAKKPTTDARRKESKSGLCAGAASIFSCRGFGKKSPAVGACLASGALGGVSGKGRGRKLSGVGGLEAKSVADVLRFLQGKGSKSARTDWNSFAGSKSGPSVPCSV